MSQFSGNAAKKSYERGLEMHCGRADAQWKVPLNKSIFENKSLNTIFFEFVKSVFKERT